MNVACMKYVEMYVIIGYKPRNITK